MLGHYLKSKLDLTNKTFWIGAMLSAYQNETSGVSPFSLAQRFWTESGEFYDGNLTLLSDYNANGIYCVFLQWRNQMETNYGLDDCFTSNFFICQVPIACYDESCPKLTNDTSVLVDENFRFWSTTYFPHIETTTRKPCVRVCLNASCDARDRAEAILNKNKGNRKYVSMCGNNFFFDDKIMPFEEYPWTCCASKMSMVTILSLEKIMCVVEALQKLEGVINDTFWTSLNYNPECLDPFHWCSSNVTLMNLGPADTWLPGEPNFKKGNCPVLKVDTAKKRFGLAMESCHLEFRSVCETSMVGIQTTAKTSVAKYLRSTTPRPTTSSPTPPPTITIRQFFNFIPTAVVVATTTAKISTTEALPEPLCDTFNCSQVTCLVNTTLANASANFENTLPGIFIKIPNKKRFFISDFKLNHSEAEKFCCAYGMSLVSLDNADKTTSISSHANMTPGLNWVAAKRSDCTETWTWCFKETPVSDFLTKSAQTDVKRKGCLLWDGVFRDAKCKDANNFICEQRCEIPKCRKFIDCKINETYIGQTGDFVGII
ncbi:uncharacterized protein LOC132204439 [Neocloeon triangulifer]|uniref:uncharacterized protein LOC132204439 n=1 Tax=Neocloeon triangulifer TaxID=2078957 RepID=UPI00286F999B|nr:uncharacterized protein LOC132204439 [Neocloeon triangulifer]